ncbi:MAG: hypothetical protein COA70_04630 [Planctomycetota bacterium]|nr:MAG: hypothetical protein COA70_04630 [Planctomycetota bacterium]
MQRIDLACRRFTDSYAIAIAVRNPKRKKEELTRLGAETVPLRNDAFMNKTATQSGWAICSVTCSTCSHLQDSDKPVLEKL